MEMVTRGIESERHTPGPLYPGLRVSVVAEANAGRPYVVRVRAVGGTPPINLYLYVDGDLVETSIPTAETFEFQGQAVASTGRHAVTARAIDARGRWGGASVLMGAPRLT